MHSFAYNHETLLVALSVVERAICLTAYTTSRIAVLDIAKAPNHNFQRWLRRRVPKLTSNRDTELWLLPRSWLRSVHGPTCVSEIDGSASVVIGATPFDVFVGRRIKSELCDEKLLLVETRLALLKKTRKNCIIASLFFDITHSHLLLNELLTVQH